ncbi:S1 domain-containing RNA-binding protein [Allofustis seminis]|uniref:S1 domain-containing RNA-binding protein n=1 Tax=Allofustis seminis TaxID=166939 RepID=UPI000373DE08|nr:S1 domain-containing RNA-binding protein [Allofustis seminis]
MSIEVGKTVTGTISGLANFGAFIDLEDNKTGLVHISEVSNKFIENINEALTVGEKVAVKVLSISEDGKIALSIKKAEGNEPKNHKNTKETYKKEIPVRSPRPTREQPKATKDFDALMSSFLKDSEDRLISLRRNTEGKRGGRGGRRG